MEKQTEVNVTDLRFSLVRVIDRLEEGKQVIVTNRNKPVAVLTKYKEKIKKEDK